VLLRSPEHPRLRMLNDDEHTRDEHGALERGLHIGQVSFF
jgi:hypothetical protein